MSNKIALALGVLILAGFALDYFYYDQDGALFLARKTVDLIEWLAFWR